MDKVLHACDLTLYYNNADCYFIHLVSMGVINCMQVGMNRVEAAARKGNTYSLGLLYGKNKAA